MRHNHNASSPSPNPSTNLWISALSSARSSQFRLNESAARLKSPFCETRVTSCSDRSLRESCGEPFESGRAHTPFVPRIPFRRRAPCVAVPIPRRSAQPPPSATPGIDLRLMRRAKRTASLGQLRRRVATPPAPISSSNAVAGSGMTSVNRMSVNLLGTKFGESM